MAAERGASRFAERASGDSRRGGPPDHSATAHRQLRRSTDKIRRRPRAIGRHQQAYRWRVLHERRKIAAKNVSGITTRQLFGCLASRSVFLIIFAARFPQTKLP